MRAESAVARAPTALDESGAVSLMLARGGVASPALRHNAELADTYGNLVNRSLTLCDKFCGGVVPEEAAEPIWSVSKLVGEVEAAFAAERAALNFL